MRQLVGVHVGLGPADAEDQLVGLDRAAGKHPHPGHEPSAGIPFHEQDLERALGVLAAPPEQDDRRRRAGGSGLEAGLEWVAHARGVGGWIGRGHAGHPRVFVG